LEIAGRYEEIFAHDMMSMDAVYHFQAGGSLRWPSSLRYGSD